jgi:hypothetical protein
MTTQLKRGRQVAMLMAGVGAVLGTVAAIGPDVFHDMSQPAAAGSSPTVYHDMHQPSIGPDVYFDM